MSFAARFFHKPSRVALAALAVFVVALAARLCWVSFVDSPYDNIFSDMGGYVLRALQAAYGNAPPLPPSISPPDAHGLAAAAAGVDAWTVQCPLYPPGAHMVYAAEMRLVGWTHHAAFLVLNCMWGAIVAPCALLLAVRVVRSLTIATAVGLWMALWYPLLAFCGFFSSEQPYAGALALSAWLLVRLVESGKGSVSAGLAASVAYLIRPQIVLTLAALTIVGLLILWRRPPRAPRLPVRRLIVAGLILTATVGWGAARYHRLSGRWGLISDNSTMTRLWADTDYGRIVGIWHAPDGHPMTFFFESPPKAELGLHRELRFDGYIGDPVQLERARRNEVHYMTLGDRVKRWVSNVRLLFVDNALWPENMHQGDGWRRTADRVTKAILLAVVLPLAFVGLISCVIRPTIVHVVCAAHVLTMLVVAAFFYAEQRYRVPYDVLLVVLALGGAKALVSQLAKLSVWTRRRASLP
ncbi:MAG TPA: hypothetical protein VF765_13475 [Polyangiaceae bacterium]